MVRSSNITITVIDENEAESAQAYSGSAQNLV